ncbi:oxygenase MpaB family protein [Actinomadura sp. WMMB 499]|uniref:oxygenase MpaB family protein n=1 Tax=Actinomadura sp. WMMB 499 TaxID=1219491 RepID=UPI00159E2637|nr:oxygenase MpaB family protein [Actinomadura sp. WMMB 499]
MTAGSLARTSSYLGPESLLWRYAGDRRYGLVMPRAAALQMLHPAIAAAAEQHSRFPGSLWAQQARAVPQAIGVVYQDAASGARVRRLHEEIKGRDGQGRRYHSLTPDVFFWEHATFVDALMTAIDLFDRPLSDEERERLYQESCIWYRRYGVSDRVVPPDYGSFVDYFDAVCEQVLELNPVFDVYREQILKPNAWLPRLLPAGLVPVLLPQPVRHLAGLAVSPADERSFRRFARTVRLSWPVLPSSLRYFPVARHAFDRQGPPHAR